MNVFEALDVLELLDDGDTRQTLLFFDTVKTVFDTIKTFFNPTKALFDVAQPLRDVGNLLNVLQDGIKFAIHTLKYNVGVIGVAHGCLVIVEGAVIK